MAAALSILVNLPWLAPAFHHRSDDIASAIVDQLPLFTSIDLVYLHKGLPRAKRLLELSPVLFGKRFPLDVTFARLVGHVETRAE